MNDIVAFAGFIISAAIIALSLLPVAIRAKLGPMLRTPRTGMAQQGHPHTDAPAPPARRQ